MRTNADEPKQAREAVAFGAEGIGLCRTEHMFFDHIDDFREMILATTLEGREKALVKLLPFQRGRLRRHLPRDGRPAGHDPPAGSAAARVLAPLGRRATALAAKIGIPAETIARRVHELHEFNPMLGHRGCRLGIVYPEITRMQARAIIEAACDVKKDGIDVHPEIMIPLAGFRHRIPQPGKDRSRNGRQGLRRKGVHVHYLVGTMVELPRAAVCADQIAEDAEFFSFGTNDLTQTTLGMSRDDYSTYINHYREKDIVPNDPFQTIDRDGVGGLMKIAVEKGRSVRRR